MNDVIDQVLHDPMVTTIGAAIGVAFVALWLAAAWWTYSDAAHRTGNPWVALLAASWIVASTPLMLPLSLPVYALVRPAESARERRTRRLAAQLTDVLEDAAGPSCSTCGNALDAGWQRCPVCSSWVALPCAACGAWSDRTLEICPFCGSEDRDEAAVEPLEPVAAAVGRQRRGRRPARAASSGRPTVERPTQRRAAGEGRPLAPARVG